MNSADGDPDSCEPDDYWYPSSLPASWQLTGEGRPAGEGPGQPPGPGYDPGPPTRIDPSGPAVPVVGPTAALRGRAGGPGFSLGEDLPVSDRDRSEWQVAHGVWSGSGIRWDESSGAAPGSGGLCAPPGHAERAFASGPSRPAASPGVQAFLSAPTMADARVVTGEASERYSAWRESVREAASPMGEAPGPPAGTSGSPQRSLSGSLARGVVPAAVIVTVGAGAFLMLTGRASHMMSEIPGNQGAHATSAARPGASARASAHARPRANTSGFGGYPGQRGTVTVSSFASSGGTRLAVGSAEGRPAIWRRGTRGTWSIVPGGQAAVFRVPGPAGLTSVAAGRAGWIAVGEAADGRPVVVTSPDGVHWRAADTTSPGAFTAPGLDITAVAASGHGYVVVGRQAEGSRRFAAMWWSPDLRTWTRAENGSLDGRLASSQIHGVTVAGAGFVAVGTHAGHASVWLTRTGLSWAPLSLPLPGGAVSAVLRFTATSGSTVVAVGEGDTGHGTLPFVALSRDAGEKWQQVDLPAPGGGTVTALTASGAGFAASGKVGGRAVRWTSPDGVTWSVAS